MNQADNKIIPYDSPEAATRQTVEGWVSRDGLFFGEDERTARYSGCTHVRCERCGRLVRKGHRLWCDKCRSEKERENYAKLERVDWDGETPLCIYRDDKYFFGGDQIEEYCESEEINLSNLMLVLCKRVEIPELSPPDFLQDYLGVDMDSGDIPESIFEAAKHFNEVLQRDVPAVWEPTSTAVNILQTKERP